MTGGSLVQTDGTVLQTGGTVVQTGGRRGQHERLLSTRRLILFLAVTLPFFLHLVLISKGSFLNLRDWHWLRLPRTRKDPRYASASKLFATCRHCSGWCGKRIGAIHSAWRHCV